jgi:hypothetical protein
MSTILNRQSYCSASMDPQLAFEGVVAAELKLANGL